MTRANATCAAVPPSGSCQTLNGSAFSIEVRTRSIGMFAAQYERTR